MAFGTVLALLLAHFAGRSAMIFGVCKVLHKTRKERKSFLCRSGGVVFEESCRYRRKEIMKPVNVLHILPELAEEVCRKGWEFRVFPRTQE